MRRLLLMLGLVVAALPARAGEPVVKGGVAVDALTPPGMARLSVAAPARAGLPARLVFGRNAPEVVMEVVVAPSADGARAAVERWLRHAANPPEPTAQVGDVGYAGAGVVVFARANVMVAVRRVAGDTDVLDVALGAEAAIDAAPAGRAEAAAVKVRLPASLAVGRAAPLALEGDVLAARVTARGPATVRRDAGGGWRLTRTGQGQIAVDVVGVDGRLRAFGR